jgi:hypothetical protein
MSITMIGTVASTTGRVLQRDLGGNVDVWTLPATSYETRQRRVPLLVGHDPEFVAGSVVYYERSKVDGLLAVAQADDTFAEWLDDGAPWYFSPAVASRLCGPLERNHGRIHELSLVRHTATVNADPVRWSLGIAPSGLPLRWYSVWDRATEAIAHDRYTHRRDDALSIFDRDELNLVDAVLCDPAVAARVNAEAAAQAKRRAAMTPTPPPTPQSSAPRVRLDGRLLDEAESERLIELLDLH